MSGDPFACLWETLYSTEAIRKSLPSRQAAHKLMVTLSKGRTLNFSHDQFVNHFDKESVDFKTLKAYASKYLRLPEANIKDFEDELESICWDICSPGYGIKRLSISESDVKKVWQLFLRLSDTKYYPPKTVARDANWLAETVKSAKSNPPIFDKTSDFMEFVHELHQKVIYQEKASQMIDELHCWLVKEFYMVGWLKKRTKKQANWTNWTKRWFILSNGKLSYYDSPTSTTIKGQMYITSHTAMSNLEQLKAGSIIRRKLVNRFKLYNAPYLEMELATTDMDEKNSWMHAIREIIETSKKGTTPVQQLLQERHDLVMANRSSAALEERLDKFRKTVVRSKMIRDQPIPIRQDSEVLPGIKENAPETDILAVQSDKMKVLFSKFDKDGNGYVDRREFTAFINELASLKMTDREIQLIFDSFARTNVDRITFDEFQSYLMQFVMDAGLSTDESVTMESQLRAAFLTADRDQTGTIDFEEFREFVWERQRSLRVSRLFHSFNALDKENRGEIEYDKFRDFCLADPTLQQGLAAISHLEEEDKAFSFEGFLQHEYKNTDIDELTKYLRSRWHAFSSFKRFGASGELVMSGASGMVCDVLPGEYNLVDLACFSDLPPIIPHHIAIKGVTWSSGRSPGQSGRLIFPKSFSGDVPIDIATSEHLRYYGCSLADTNQIQVSLLYRHGIQDFTYQNKYLDDYVKNEAAMGGAGLERHDFSHLDCPLGKRNGLFVLAKFENETEIHITAFRVPTRHTIYVPGGVIHSNDYLTGTWRTMLSDEAEIDHVQLVFQSKTNANANQEYEHFHFKFHDPEL